VAANMSFSESKLLEAEICPKAKNANSLAAVLEFNFDYLYSSGLFGK
jgi:hypothetical protein